MAATTKHPKTMPIIITTFDPPTEAGDEETVIGWNVEGDEDGDE